MKVCSDDFNAFFGQFFRQFECGLSSKLNNDTFWFFQFYNVFQMFPKYGFEIKLVRDIGICGDRFWIAVDHDGFITRIFYGEDTMYTAVRSEERRVGKEYKCRKTPEQ